MASTPYRELYASQALMVSRATVRTPIEALDPAGLTELDRLLEVWTKIDLRPADLDTDGVEYSADKHRDLVRQGLSNLLDGVGGMVAGRVEMATAEAKGSPVSFWGKAEGCKPWFEGGCYCGTCA